MHLHKFKILNQCFIYVICYILFLLKYFIIIKKEEIVALWIDFDDYNIFEGVTNDFDLKKDLLYFRSKFIILSSFDSKVSRTRTEDLWSIEGNFIFFGYIFWEKIEFKEKGRPLGRPLSKGAERHVIFFWLVHSVSRPLSMSRPYESTSIAV